MSLAGRANVAGGYAEPARSRLMDEAFDPKLGPGLNVVRYNIGGGKQPGHPTLRFRAARPAVFDWGGGTLDVPLLEVVGGTRVREPATEGMDRAGDEIDRLIADRLHRQITAGQADPAPFADVGGDDRDRPLVDESAKRALSDGGPDVPSVGVTLDSYLSRPAMATLDRGALLDETSHPKKGDHTPGVKRQYCGARGKTDNCVVTVHLRPESIPRRAMTVWPRTHCWSSIGGQDRRRKVHAARSTPTSG